MTPVVADDVRALHKMGAFTGIKSQIETFDDGRLKVVFMVSELPYIGEVIYEGIGWWTRSDLEKVVSVSVVNISIQ